MLNFVKKAFRSCFVALLWINLVGSVITGGVGGYIGGSALSQMGIFGDVSPIVWAVAGVLFGAVTGLISNIIIGGLIATFLVIGSDVADIKADIVNIKGLAADTRTSTAETAAVFQKMANRNAPGA